ncbi:MAG: hypothetical protein JWM33_279 [Caulobacteraceae bacterium]|nr:hypothetical protein [Caulobacteraceae bacterium]
MRMATVLSALALGACSSLQGSLQGNGVRSYSLSPGVATYDAIRDASQTCTSQNGALELRANGDSQSLDNYVCKISNPATATAAAPAPEQSATEALLATSGADVFGIKASGTSLNVEGYTPDQIGEVQACLQTNSDLDTLNRCFKDKGLSAVGSIDQNGPRGAIEFDRAGGQPSAANMAMLNRCLQVALPSDDGHVQIDSPANIAAINACLRANNIAQQVIPGSLN